MLSAMIMVFSALPMATPSVNWDSLTAFQVNTTKHLITTSASTTPSWVNRLSPSIDQLGDKTQIHTLRGLGITLETLTADSLKHKQEPVVLRGVLISYVYPDSLAAEAGVQAGDILMAVDDAPIASIERAVSMLQDPTIPTGAATLELRREGESIVTKIERTP